jgi:pyruvate,orthophosphate dikinase
MHAVAGIVGKTPDHKTAILGRGLAASAGAASGTLVFTCESAASAASRGEKVILCRPETSADDIMGMQV